MTLRPPRFGALCRSDAHPRPLVILGGQGDRFEAVPMSEALAAPSLWLKAAALQVIGEDLPAARAIAMRRRAACASDAFDMAAPTTSVAAVPNASSARPVRTAMILCAGLGTRLRPLTDHFPKPAVPFFGAPLVRYTFALLKGAGIERAVINTHHLPELMAAVARAEARRLGLDLAISHEPRLMDTAGGLREARHLLGGERCLLVNGDAFLSLDLTSLIDRHVQSGALASLAVMPPVPGENFRAIEADATGRIARIRGMGTARAGLLPWHFLGVHVIEPEVFDAIAAEGPRDINGEVYPALMARGACIQALPVRVGAWADLGTPRRYLDACQDLLSGQCDLAPLGRAAPLAPGDGRIRGEGSKRTFIDGSARVAADAAITCAIVGPEVEVGHGARVTRSVLLAGVRIGAGQIVEDAIVWPEGRMAISV